METPLILKSQKLANYYSAPVKFGDFNFNGLPEYASQRAMTFNTETEPQNEQHPMSQRRIVQVIIADPNENIPLADCILYKSQEKLTDLTDQELYFEISIANLLKDHNERRVLRLDREATKRSGRDVLLDEAKVRDLKMMVIEIAKF